MADPERIDLMKLAEEHRAFLEAHRARRLALLADRPRPQFTLIRGGKQ